MVDRSLFRQKAPKIMSDLMSEFDLDDIQTAGVLGNIGTECAGFHVLHEIGQPEGKGGYGWAQWTGPRRVSFFAWCDKHKLKWQSDEASYGYLLFDLHGAYVQTIASLHKAHSLEAAVMAFERNYEGAGTPNYDSRNAWAQIALDAFRGQAGA